ncbi:MAG TPA: ATP-binding protein [Vicinamibacterales bacterium]|nr:ATP-binding protein [Vicinamibacterales bacterium]
MPPSRTVHQALTALLAHAAAPTDLLPHLHQYALDATGGCSSLLFQFNPRNATLQATSGVGVDALPTGQWDPAGLLPAAAREPTLVADARVKIPDLAARLQASAALLLPLVRRDERVGLLAIGFAAPPASAIIADVSEAADAFLVALELFQLRQREEVQGDIRALLDEFTGSLAATLNIAAGLDIFCFGANRLFGADRTSVWIHDRRARQLALKASSDPQHAAGGATVAADDVSSPAAAAMRRARAEIAASDGSPTWTVTVPLRGTRRALGTIVFEGMRVDPGGELDVLDRADELGRQLSSAIENMQLLEDVARSRRELENTFDSIAHLVAVSDSRGLIVHVNRAFASRVGRTRGQLLNQPLGDYLGSELKGWLRQVEAASGHSADAATTIGISDPVLNGTFIVTASALVDHEGARAGSVLVARDLTSQTQLEAEREELRKRLMQSEKLAALGQFVAGIAHELNNPLQGVLGHLELLRRTNAFPKKLRKDVQTVYREADRAAKIVHNLLIFAGSRRVAPRPVSLPAVVQKVLAVRAQSLRKGGIEVVRHYQEQLPRLKSDPLLLHQVFLNMVMNAEQAMVSAGAGGRIEIAARTTPAGDRVVTTVRDTGPGIPEETLPRVFEPFYTTKDVGKGTGLGLAIAYGIVQDHGGQISAANHPEGGAVFTVELPAARSAREQGPGR